MKIINRDKNTKTGKLLYRIAIAIICILINAALVAGCVDNADNTMHDELPDYNSIMSEFDAYSVGYSNYMNETDIDFIYYVSDGFTPSDVPCYVNFSRSADGAYCLVSVETRTETEMGVDIRRDEYYPLSENKLYIVRHLSNDIKGSISTTAFLMMDGTLYQINTKTATLTVVTKADTLDLYLSFSELESLYGEGSHDA